MARLEDLADLYGRHIATPWQRNVAGAQRVIMLVYDKELERTLRARRAEFQMRTTAAGHDWHEVDLTAAFADWIDASWTFRLALCCSYSSWLMAPDGRNRSLRVRSTWAFS